MVFAVHCCRFQAATPLCGGTSRPCVTVRCCAHDPYSRQAARAERRCGQRTPARRELLLRSVALPPVLASMLIGSDDPGTIINSVLSAYGLPTLIKSAGFKVLDDFELPYLLEYPRSWVVRQNTLRGGLYISDFQTADKVTVDEFALPDDGDLLRAAVRTAVVPTSSQQDDKLLLPPDQLVKSRTETVDGADYLFLEFPSETITRSGYNIRRKNLAVVGTKRSRAFVLNASARSDQYNKDKEAILRRVVESFRVR